MVMTSAYPDRAFTDERTTEIVAEYLRNFAKYNWYGMIEIKLENGQVRHVQAKPVVRTVNELQPKNIMEADEATSE